MFYKKGIDITNDKQMFEFLHDHFRYDTLSSWNGLKSVANNVKIYNLGLEGDPYEALNFLEDDNYEELSYRIEEWEREHKGYRVCFNGRSSGYLVLYNERNNRNVLPDYIASNDYEGYKQYCKDYNGSVRGNRYELRELTKLVQDFDRLCDDLRDYVNRLSKMDFANCITMGLVDAFNANYEDDFEFCKFKYLEMEDDGKVNVKEIKKLNSLYNAFKRYLDKRDYGYKTVEQGDYIWLEAN